MRAPATIIPRNPSHVFEAVLLTLVVSLGCGGGSSSSLTQTTTSSAPGLTVTVTHSGNFQVGQQAAVYTITVKNTGTAPTTGVAVSVTETLPTGMTLTSLAGAGWSCPANTCSRTDVLSAGASYPVITATVNVAAGTAGTLTNTVSVLGGGSAPATATDATVIDPVPITAALSVTMSHVGALSAGQDFVQYTVIVSNASNAQAATAGTVSVQDVFPQGESASVWAFDEALDGTSPGWFCLGSPPCTRTDPLPPGKSYPPLTIFVKVSPKASSPQVNTVTVTAPNSLPATATDSTVIGGPDACKSWPTGGESLLTGQYAMVAQGWQGKTNATPVGMAFSVALDGHGNAIDLGGGKAGDLDLNSAGTGPQHFTVNSSGSYYTVGSGHTLNSVEGCLRLETSGGPFTFVLGPRDVSSGVAATAAVLQINDETGANSSLLGQMRIQDSAAFTSGNTTALHANYAFGEHGQTASGRFATAGALVLDPATGTVTSFSADQNSAGSLASIAGAGAVTSVSSLDGRALFTTQANARTSSHVIYIVNANELFILGADAFNAADAVRSGMAVVSSASYSAASITGNHITHTAGQIACTSNSSGRCANGQLGLLHFASTSSTAGSVTASLFQDDAQNGPSSSSVTSANAATFAVASNTGRVTLANFGTNTPVLYLASPAANSDPVTFFVVGTDVAASYGYAELGAAQPVTIDSLVRGYSIANDDLGDSSVWAQMMSANIQLNSVPPLYFFAGDLNYTVPGAQWLRTMDVNGDYESAITISNVDPNNNPAPGVGTVGLGLIAITNGHTIYCLVEGTQLNKPSPVATNNAAVILIAVPN